jgi:peptidoglycan/xylan/chitin deacetylase (PgdA/CDA1 family)
MIVLGAVLVLLFFLFVRWRVAYGYPPTDIPPVLCYHKLSDRFCLEGTWTTTRRFLDQIDRLRDRGYRFIGEDDFYECLDQPSPDHSTAVLLTFDDGYESVYEVFTEHLAPRGVPVLVFVVMDYVGKENAWDLSLGRRPFRHLSWEQILEMMRRGAAFGAHGATHVDLAGAPADLLEREVAGSRRALGERTGRAPRSFSYPFGRYDAAVERAAERAGYDGAFSLYPRHSNTRVDRFAIRRNGVYVIDTDLTIRLKIQRTPLFWVEEMKCRTINSVAALTPMLKRASRAPDT